MALNPITYTEKVVGDFLKYQLTAYAFADEGLREQMRKLLSLEETRRTPLLKGPYVTLSRSFRTGVTVGDLVADGALHPFMKNLIPYPNLYGHQEKAIRAIVSGRTTLISTGTGSGKTECFLYPVISRCLKLRDEGAEPGIVAVFVYPMNALAEDQLQRLRELLAGTGISFGMYIGKTPERRADVAGERLGQGASQADYQVALKRARVERRGTAVHPPGERCSREEMRRPGNQPRVLLTNAKQLELLLTRKADIEMFDGARLEFLVFDEAHTYGGAAGAETACLIRRLRAFCGREATETVCIGTSATLLDADKGLEAGREFAARFFGVPAGSVEVVGEEYQKDDWARERRPSETFPGDPAKHLTEVLRAVDAGGKAGVLVAEAYKRMTGQPLLADGSGALDDWAQALYDRLSENDLCYRLAEALSRPVALGELSERLSKDAGRQLSEEEILCWLALGASSRRDGRPLLRPVVHVFVSGVSGAVVTFPLEEEGPRLWLSAQETEDQKDGLELFRLPLLTCNTCGQHYFVHYVADLAVGRRGLEGGEAVDGGRVWRSLEEAQGGRRVLLVDHIVGIDEEDSEPRRAQQIFLCRFCGAIHPAKASRCSACGRESELVALYAMEQDEKRPDNLVTCRSCRTNGKSFGGRFREPARPVRAVAVSDVHVLAQNMLQNAERRRLLVFADNRQDAAFQAGWMRDHARRYRLRALMAERINDGAVSVGDLVAHLDRFLDQDNELSRALIPEVWSVQRKEAAGVLHAEERKRFLRILVLREITTRVKQRVGLEPWGRLKVEYLGLGAHLSFVEKWAGRIDVEPARLADGIAALLDYQRRGYLCLLDREGKIFSRTWRDGDHEIQRGYLPLLRGVPAGLKLERRPTDKDTWVKQWLSSRGDTLVRKAVKAFGVSVEEVEEFVRELWVVLEEELELLAPVTLRGSSGRALPHCSGTRQIDADRLLLSPHRGRWRCTRCQRTQVRPTPGDRCLAWRCGGNLRFEEDDPDNYDLAVLNQGFAMLRPAEHSAQVPTARREELEHLFKGEGEAINTLVCTPTLELGVDIGALDTVLLRNVPPLPSNYWQRAGRAGRRHRLAVSLTYARAASHDRAYFADPLKLLEGRVEPPRFNMKNEVMLGKHVRAAVLTCLYQLSRPSGGLGEYERSEIAGTLETVLPARVREYLFDASGQVRDAIFDVSSLDRIVKKHADDLVKEAERVFARSWPDQDRLVVQSERLREVVLGTGAELESVIRRVKKRLEWCLEQMRRLDDERRRRGTLEADQDALYKRCDAMVKKLKGVERRRFREAEGYDDTNTYAVLAAEGFLPGYGLETGSIVGTASVPRHLEGDGDFELPRPPAVALREYVPGNFIYANGRRFVPRHFHLEVDDELLFQVDVGREAVREVGVASEGAVQSLGATSLRAVNICDVDLAHASHITDDEEHRFQLPVAIYGYEQGRHGEGRMYQWGERSVALRRTVFLRLVNVGAASLVTANKALGYPVCLVCGQSRSPFSSEREREEFSRRHQERCAKPVEAIGFCADIVADTLTLSGCPERTHAFSLVETIRLGMSRVLEMEREDVQVLVVGQVGSDQVDAMLYDPMPGGSGLLEQACERWGEVVEAALEAVEQCPSLCNSSCIDCLQTFRNAYFHRYLDRNVAAEFLRKFGGELKFTHDIPPRLPREELKQHEMPVNVAEARLRDMLERAGFPTGKWHREISLGRPLGTTKPDVFFDGDDPDDPGVCIYLDGLSKHIHGNPKTAARDLEIRETLRHRGYEVFEITATELDDRDAMARHFFRLARTLTGKEDARRVRSDPSWFGAPAGGRATAEVSEDAAATATMGDEGYPTPGSQDEIPAGAESPSPYGKGGSGKRR